MLTVLRCDVVEVGDPERQHHQRAPGLCYSPEERAASIQYYRLPLAQVAGRMNRNNCDAAALVCSRADIARLSALPEVLDLPTQGSRMQSWPCGHTGPRRSFLFSFSHSTQLPGTIEGTIRRRAVAVGPHGCLCAAWSEFGAALVARHRAKSSSVTGCTLMGPCAGLLHGRAGAGGGL